MNDTHHSTTRALSDYIDGELDATARAVVDRHLPHCADCRATLHDLRTVVDAAGRLPGRMPARDLWTGIEARVGSPAAAGGPFGRAPRRRFVFTLPQLAAAGLALMVMSGGLVYLAVPGYTPEPLRTVSGQPDGMTVSPVSLADPHYEDAVGDLERLLAEGRDRLDPETVRVIQQNLETIDHAIAQSREALEADPGNVFLNSHLVSARQRKLALLRRATALTTGS